eukprot:s801_g3.t3
MESPAVQLSEFPGSALCRILSFVSAVEWGRVAQAHQSLILDLDCLLEESSARLRAEAQSLGEAARYGDVAVLMEKLRKGLDPNERDRPHPKYTPLHRAASGGHRAAVRLLLQHRADVMMRDRLGFSVLHFAANQSLELVSDLLQARCDVNAANLQQTTPLHSAAGMGRVDICELLVDAGARGGGGVMSPADLARRAAERRCGTERDACLDLARQLNDLAAISTAARPAWMFEESESGYDPEVWLPFETTASARLEDAHQRGEDHLDFETSTNAYTATGRVRRIRRVLLEAAGQAWVPAAPGHWSGLVSNGLGSAPASGNGGNSEEVKAARPFRERRLERWNRLAMLREDRPRHQSRKAALPLA